MARERRQGAGSITVWMIVFVALWLASTVLLVILYTGQEELRSENKRLTEDNQRLISSRERNSLELFRQASKDGPTVVALLEGARGETARLATGDDADDPAAIRNKLEEFLGTIRSDRIVPQPDRFEDISYHEAMTLLYKAFDAKHAAQLQGRDRVKQLETEVRRLDQAVTQTRNEFDKRAKELSEQLVDVEQDRARYRVKRDEDVARLGREFEERRAQGDADLTEERQHSAGLTEQLGRLQERIIAFQDRFKGLLMGPGELSTARQPDGRILTAFPGDQVVYIDLGHRHRLVLGLRFAVYTAQSGIPVDGRSKGQIEVVSMDNESAECRIVDVAADTLLLEGDLIANPIYDSSRAVNFVVLGEFDLDHNGIPDPNGAQAIGSMITNWGGTIAEELTALTDFVVLGQAPRRPKPARDVTPEQTARVQAMQQLYDRYDQALQSAKTLAVPIMTQEVFLNFLGYTGRYARHGTP